MLLFLVLGPHFENHRFIQFVFTPWYTGTQEVHEDALGSTLESMLGSKGEGKLVKIRNSQPHFNWSSYSLIYLIFGGSK